MAKNTYQASIAGLTDVVGQIFVRTEGFVRRSATLRERASTARAPSHTVVSGVRLRSSTRKSGNYVIYSSSSETFPVYCDMESEPRFVWILSSNRFFFWLIKGYFKIRDLLTISPRTTLIARWIGRRTACPCHTCNLLLINPRICEQSVTIPPMV